MNETYKVVQAALEDMAGLTKLPVLANAHLVALHCIASILGEIAINLAKLANRGES